MSARFWLFIGLVTAFGVAFSVKEHREKNWIFAMWFPVTAFAICGTSGFLYAAFSLGSVPNDAAGGFLGLGLVILLGLCAPFLLLLYLCIRYRPGQQAYTRRYVVPTIIAVLIVIASIAGVLNILTRK